MLFNRVLKHLKKRKKIDLFRKVIHSLDYYCFRYKPIRKIRSWFYFKSWNVEIGRNVLLKGLPYDIQVGKGTTFYDNCICLLTAEESVLKIGNNCFFAYSTLICCSHKIEIGNDVQIGEFSSIRDTTHSYEMTGKPMKYNADVSSPIIIGNDVWIGRGCIIMPGTIIGDGVVVGANSVIKGSLKSYSIYAGTPARLIKPR